MARIDQWKRDRGVGKFYLAADNGGPLSKKQSHVAGNIEGSCQPAPRTDIELRSSIIGSLLDCGDGLFEASGVQGGAITDSSEVRKIEDVRAKLGDRRRRNKEDFPIPLVGLPIEQQRERENPAYTEGIAIGNLREGRHGLTSIESYRI